jgi:hypothetical protein
MCVYIYIYIYILACICVCSPCVLREEELVSVNLWCSLVSQRADIGPYIDILSIYLYLSIYI